MAKINKIKAMLQSVLAQFAKMSTDKGLLQYDGDEIEVGSSVSLVDDEGNEVPAENGEYKNEEGIVYVVEDGKVTEIREPEAEPESAPESEQEPEENAPESEQESAESAEDNPQNEEAEAEPEAEPEADDRDERIANLEAEVARLERENGELRERIAELEAKLEEPAAPPAEEQFEQVVNPSTGDKNIDKIRKYFKN